MALSGTEVAPVHLSVVSSGLKYRSMASRMISEGDPVPRVGPELTPFPVNLVVPIRLGILVDTVLCHDSPP